MRTTRKNSHRVSPALPQDDSNQAKHMEYKIVYAPVTEVGIDTTTKPFRRHRYSESNSYIRTCRRRTPNKTLGREGDQLDRNDIYQIVSINSFKTYNFKHNIFRENQTS